MSGAPRRARVGNCTTWKRREILHATIHEIAKHLKRLENISSCGRHADCTRVTASLELGVAGRRSMAFTNITAVYAETLWVSVLASLSLFVVGASIVVLRFRAYRRLKIQDRSPIASSTMNDPWAWSAERSGEPFYRAERK